MAGADNIIINNFERALSSDINDLQALKDRNVLEAFKYMLAGDLVVTPGTGYGTQVRSLVLGGLTCAPNSGDVDVAPGVLMQNSSSLAPAPGALDSSFRFARNASTQLVSLPAGDGFYLVEAQMSRVVALTTTRDIYDPVSQTFSSVSVDKRAERQITFQVLTGTITTAPTPTGGDWVPLYIAQKSGGAVASLIDVRPMLTNLRRTHSTIPAQGLLHSTAVFKALGTADMCFSNLHVETARNAMFIRLEDPDNPVDFNLKDASIVAVGNPQANGTWQYGYLSEWFGLTPRYVYGSDYLNQGVFVVSDAGTSRVGDRSMPSGIQLPPPFDGYTTVGDGDGLLAALLALDTGGDCPVDSYAVGLFQGDFGGATVANATSGSVVSCLTEVGNVFPDGVAGMGIRCRFPGDASAHSGISLSDSGSIFSRQLTPSDASSGAADRAGNNGAADVRGVRNVEAPANWMFTWGTADNPFVEVHQFYL